jgi:hypothetical protein
MDEAEKVCGDEFVVGMGLSFSCERPSWHEGVHSKLAKSQEGRLFRISWGDE